MNDLAYLEQDNLAYALAANSSDSDLAKFDKTLLKKISKILGTWFTWSRAQNLKQKERINQYLRSNIKDESDNKAVYMEEERNKAIDFVKDNEEAYLKGNERWESGSRNNNDYNNILIVDKKDADKNHLKVYRYFSNGVYSLIDTEALTQEKYIEEKNLATYQNTYCNIAANKIGLSYEAPNIQNHGGSEHNANAIYDNFVNGFYNTDSHEFKKVNFDKAEQYASSGGLAYAIWKKSGGTGHIGTLTGGYGGDGKKKMANLKIFQAGANFGEMLYKDGFGSDNVSNFYIWKKK